MIFDVFAKWCPICTAKCEKVFLFQHEFYWKCPKCKIDADDPKYSTIKSKPVKAWDDEQTEPKYSMSGYGISSAARLGVATHLKFPVKDCEITSKMTTTDPITGVVKADIKIMASGIMNGVGRIEVFQETFEPSIKNTGTNDEMWEDISLKVLRSIFAVSVDDIKKEFLVTRLQQRFPHSTLDVR